MRHIGNQHITITKPLISFQRMLKQGLLIENLQKLFWIGLAG
ncbi:hypothetical protein P278_15320 [Zhouia amylolytica AD3]|uniref:Uncharacterized protein n=1 Tax=Zhouia amylolytica AD3 TaxID=1286632 RepID=W2UNT8_9FLAO|nr:hypothetical protein P278_15320 [Zhouia amylolytica AD3]